MKNLIVGCILMSISLSAFSTSLKSDTCTINIKQEVGSQSLNNQYEKFKKVLESKGFDVMENGNSAYTLEVNNGQQTTLYLMQPKRSKIRLAYNKFILGQGNIGEASYINLFDNEENKEILLENNSSAKDNVPKSVVVMSVPRCDVN